MGFRLGQGSHAAPQLTGHPKCHLVSHSLATCSRSERNGPSLASDFRPSTLLWGGKVDTDLMTGPRVNTHTSWHRAWCFGILSAAPVGSSTQNIPERSRRLRGSSLASAPPRAPRLVPRTYPRSRIRHSLATLKVLSTRRIRRSGLRTKWPLVHTSQ